MLELAGVFLLSAVVGVVAMLVKRQPLGERPPPLGIAVAVLAGGWFAFRVWGVWEGLVAVGASTAAFIVAFLVSASGFSLGAGAAFSRRGDGAA